MVKQIVILLTTFAILVTVLPAEAQEAGKVYRIGFLTSGTVQHLKPWLAAFRKGLQELGYVEGRNIVIEERYGNPQNNSGRSFRSSGWWRGEGKNTPIDPVSEAKHWIRPILKT